MLPVCVFHCAALVLYWTMECVALQVSERDGPRGLVSELRTVPRDKRSHHTVDSIQTGDGLGIKNTDYTLTSKDTSADATIAHHAPCAQSAQSHGGILDDVFAALREGQGSDSKMTNSSLTQFGICTTSDGSSATVLSELSNAANRDQRNGLGILHPTKELLTEDRRLVLTLDVPQSPLLRLNPVLLLVFGHAFTAINLDVTFSSQSLHPDTQTACISEETQYIILTGKTPEGNGNQNWLLSIETTSPDTGLKLHELLLGGESGSNISMTPILLFLTDRGTDLRSTQVASSSPGSSETFLFLCELQKFLGDVLPQDQPESTSIQLDSLQSLPPLTLGLSSSETVLAGLLNSSAPTIFSFSAQASVLQVHRGQLALPPALLEVLRQRLQQAEVQITEIMREEEVGHTAMERLERLKALSAIPRGEPAAGESQYRAFLLFKALQTMTGAYEVERGLRAARGGQDSPVSGNRCGLHSLTVSLRNYFVGPDTTNIYNCQGACVLPLYNTNNHAALLDAQVRSGRVLERPPCCVPVAYEGLDVMELSEGETRLHIKPDMVAKECGCR